MNLCMNNSEKVNCPLCNDTVDKLLYRYHIDSERKVIEKIKEDHPAWAVNDGVCTRCVDYYHITVIQGQQMLPSIGPYFPVKTADDYIVLPTGLRVDAHPRYTGKGVTICFLDSGFYMHPDLVNYRRRIKTIVDVTEDGLTISEEFSNDAAWHGTMTTVVCAGDGFLSNGLYKGIASDAELVLVKVQDNSGKITTENIVKGLQWVLQHYEEYTIRVVNISLGDDIVASYKESSVAQLAEELIAKGITVVAAAGNEEHGYIHPPASSLNVIAVGGINDENSLDAGGLKAYHSTYGLTVDAFMKPEVVAHAMWIAAPVLPGTKEQAEADALYKLFHADNEQLVSALNTYIAKTDLDAALIAETNNELIKKAVLKRVQQAKYISPHYMHVDGTSFAAPIVSAVITQLLQANPALTPAMIREVLFSTSKRIDSIIPERQGFGVIQPRKALLKVLRRETISKPNPSPYVNLEKNSIEFYMQNGSAEQVSLAGLFNNWAKDVLLLEPGLNGLWKIEIPLLPAGRYEYKFLIDGNTWVEDVDNPYRLPDGFNGFNSLLIIQN